MEALFKQYFWVLKALGISIAAALAASTVTTYFGTSYIYGEPAAEDDAETSTGTDGAEEDDDDDKPAASPLAASPRGPSAAERKKVADAILALNLFCPTCTKIVAGPETPDSPGKIDPVLDREKMAELIGKQPGEAACTLPLRLVATMETNMPEYSWATIRDEEDGSVGPYWPGDRIRPGVLLAKVERAMVHVNNEGSLQYIELGVEPPKPTAKAPAEKKKKDEEPKKDASAIPGAADAIKCESENSCTVKREFIDELFANPAALTKQARVMPSIKDGETKGFKFYGIRPDSLPKLLGMKNGDLLMSVNGTELKSVDQVMGLITKLRRASNLSVTIERKGESITKDITIQ